MKIKVNDISYDIDHDKFVIRNEHTTNPHCINFYLIDKQENGNRLVLSLRIRHLDKCLNYPSYCIEFSERFKYLEKIYLDICSNNLNRFNLKDGFEQIKSFFDTYERYMVFL